MSLDKYIPNSGGGQSTNNCPWKDYIQQLKYHGYLLAQMNSSHGMIAVGHWGIMSPPTKGKSSVTRAIARELKKEVKNEVVREKLEAPKPQRIRRIRNRPLAVPTTMPSDIGEVASRNVKATDEGRAVVETAKKTKAMTPEGQAWAVYHLDPAGYHETPGRKPRMLYITDGALPKGVGGEIRQIDVLTSPSVTPANVPLDGSQWSLTIIQPGTFRLNYIAVASMDNEDITEDTMNYLCASINDFVHPALHTNYNWMQLHNHSGELLPNWYWKPVFHKQTADLPEPVNGIATTVDKWRIVGSSNTMTFNAPMLINQGYAVGGQFARAAVLQTLEESMESFRMVIQTTTAGQNGLIAVHNSAITSLFNIPGATPDTTGVGVPFFNSPPLAMEAKVELRIAGELFASPGDIIQLSRSPVGEAGILSVLWNNTTDPLIETFAVQASTLIPGAIVPFYFEVPVFEGQFNATRSIIPMPPVNMSDIITNDPDAEASLLARAKGVYGVHVKTGEPVYRFASATSFAPINFSARGYEQPVGGAQGGIRDTLDPNVGTIAVTFKGISRSAQIVTKKLQMWEGMPSANSTVGQFAETGGVNDQCALEFVDNFAGQSNNIYAATDNFLGTIARCIRGIIGSLFSHEATPAVVRGIADIACKQVGQHLLKNVPMV